MKKNIAIIGAGGFGRETACCLRAINGESPSWNLIGFFDDGVAAGTENEYGRVLGTGRGPSKKQAEQAAARQALGENR